jgi:mannose-P-dolichol utilization defect 1
MEFVIRSLPKACAKPNSLLDLPGIVLSDGACFKATLSLALGLGIVLFAGIIKLPQILKILDAKSAEGIAISTVLLETFGYVYNFAAHVRLRYPVSTYGDFAVLILQNLVILVLMYRFSNRLATGIIILTGYVSLLLLMCSPFFPLHFLESMILGNVLLSVASRVPQIARNFTSKSTGTLSAITCWGVFLGASARVFTTLQDVDSVNILIGYVTGACLNGIIAFQVLYYHPSASKKSA